MPSNFEKHAAGDTWRRLKRLLLGLFIFGLSVGGAAAQAEPAVVDIPGSADPQTRTCLRDLLIRSVTTPNTTVRMGPDVDFDFTDVKGFPIQLGRSVTLTSVASFGPIVPANPCIRVVAKQGSRSALPAHANVDIGREEMVAPLGAGPSARSPHTRGPVLRYGKHPDLSDTTAFLQASCGGGLANEGVRLSGFRLFGPSMGDQTTDEVGLRVEGCQDVEVSNMEIAGWAGAGIEVRDLSFTDIPPTEPNPIRVLIHDSYFHDNRHPSEGGDLDGLLGGHAEGYGVNAGRGGWMRVYNNAFDNNRHAVAADGKAGGYQAAHNLILKGGGYHGAWYEKFTHVMDAHGTDNCNTLSSSAWNCGDAGRAFTISENVFQYTRNDDIHIRGNPRGRATIENNIFARSDEDAAIDGSDNSNVDVQRNNRYNVDDFGKYGICDFDGDGIDDLFFATGVTWWMSGQGRFPWTFLRADRLPRGDLRFGYFDGDPRCDVAVELPTGSGQWFISSGGVTDPLATPLVTLGRPGDQIAFGRFDPSVRDHRPGVTRQTTHAFWRRDDGQWFVAPLAGVNKGVWTAVQSSSFPLSQLRFGDFTGDGVTDVLAVVGGHWSISESARGGWRTLNPRLGDPVQDLYIANMDTDDNIDDILRLDRKYSTEAVGMLTYEVARLTWWRSKNGIEPWKAWKTYTRRFLASDGGFVPVTFGFAGRLGRSAGEGATMIIDETRMGNFAGRRGLTSWQSEVPY